MSTEKVDFMNQTIAIYAKNKVGQYSKFLNKNPIFVTYYSLNEALCRNDVGTGSIANELGKNSPLRYNKINNLPVYNVPDLKAEVEFNDTGPDMTLDLSDITLLPNTVKPRILDYMLIVIPGTKELLFRVNQHEANTIQSNDFYNISLDLKYAGTNLEATYFDGLIAETYDTIFENIGTQDKCFVKLEDEAKITEIASLITTLKDFYKGSFFDKPTNAFVLRDNPEYSDFWMYDYFLSHFISMTGIYANPDSEETLVLTLLDNIPRDFEYQFKRTFWNAIITQSLDYMNDYNYYYQTDVTKRLSTFIIDGYPCKRVQVEILGQAIADPTTLQEYFSHTLVSDIRAGTLTSTDYLDQVIFSYMTGNGMEVDSAKIIPYTFTQTIRTYTLMPIIIYILKEFYCSYFKKLE